EAAQRGAETAGGTAWLGEKRQQGLRHEECLFQLIRSHKFWRRHDPKARPIFTTALNDLEDAVRAEENKIKQKPLYLQDFAEPEVYQQALLGFKYHLAVLRQMAARPLPAGVLRALAEYLPECW